ncbi:MAG TPA: gamma-glutamyltransferase [Bacillota bacterium]|nr:gamma-glutamyltransferase [Bacillota bacterium]
MDKSSGISAAHPLAVEAGMNILRKGGNAVDAAVTVSFVLGVVEPYASGIGGGGNMLILPENGREPVVYDYRETAPKAIHSTYKIGVPGFVKGMETVHRDHGELSWQDVLQPAIHLANNGFKINAILANNLQNAHHVDWSKDERLFPNGVPLNADGWLVQKELAHLMEQIVTEGSHYFYEGAFAKKIVDENIGMTLDDLLAYDVKQRKPLRGHYQSTDIYTAPAPVAGSLLLQALKLIEQTNLDDYQTDDVLFKIGLSEILQLCFHEFYYTIGDPDFESIDENQLLEEAFPKLLRHMKQKQYVRPKKAIIDENNTTHFSVIDANGMAVATTNTLSSFFGSGLLVDSIYLNNQMQNYTDEVDLPNSVVHGKRCTSTIAPTIMTSADQPHLIIGASGAGRIPFSLAKVIVDTIKHGKTVDEAIQDERFFAIDHKLYTEKRLTDAEIARVAKNGYEYVYHPDQMFYGGVQAIHLKDQLITGAADRRRGGIFQYESLQK